MINPDGWRVEKIAVIGAGIVGVPMAALLAKAKIHQGTDSWARVVIIQRNSRTSGWKVDALNSGKSPIGGIEPELDKIVMEAVSEGLLRASHDFSEVTDADVILICVQTDKQDLRPDYGPLFEAMKNVSNALIRRPPLRAPLIIFESTLAPTSMASLIKDYFAKHGLLDGKEIMLGNSPNRVMPGHLVQRIRESDKIIGGLRSEPPKLIKALYSTIVLEGTLHLTNSLTAEFVKTLENAYRDVRIAYSTEIARYCDANDIDFYEVRERVNKNLNRSDHSTEHPTAVPTGAILIPTIGVGGHCLPKDGILLLWKMIEAGENIETSLILESRRINDESPAEAIHLMERSFGEISGRSIALLGTAYKFNSGDTRNSPTLALAQLLLKKGCSVSLHDPYVRSDDQNLAKFNLQPLFTNDTEKALFSADFVVFCTSHRLYSEEISRILRFAPNLKGIFDGCNAFRNVDFSQRKFAFSGIGKGRSQPPEDFVNFVYGGFLAVEKGFANEVQSLINFLNKKYVTDDFNRLNFSEIQRLARTCLTGCDITNPGPVDAFPIYKKFIPRLVKRAQEISH
jgi:UDP-N-acetyl-D-mannosaminuronic acid dehydrogenase